MNDMNAQPATNAPAGSAGTDPDSAYVRISHVTKRFGDFVAVDDVSLDIRRGEIFCLLGGSGSGKTTLLRMLAGFERPSAGTISRISPTWRRMASRATPSCSSPKATFFSTLMCGKSA